MKKLNKKKIILIFVFFAIIISFITFYFYYQKENKKIYKGYEITNYVLENNKYNLLIADNSQKWEKGLMYIKNNNDFDGMLFVFPDRKYRTFWNKNTYIELDIYWMDENKIIGKDMLPSIKKSGEIVTVTSKKPVNQVVEIIK